MKYFYSLIFLLLSIVGTAQCEVYIVPGSSVVHDHNPGISFGFEIQNDSDVPYTGGTLYLDFALSNGAVWDFGFNAFGMILPGDSKYIGTPVFDIPLPENIPGNWEPYAGWTGTNYFPPGWKLFLDDEFDCLDYVLDDTQPNGYFNNPLSDGCYNPDGDNFCNDACNVEIVDFNIETTELTIIPYSTYCPNLNSQYWENQYPFDNPYIFGFQLNFNWGIDQINISIGNQDIYTSNEPITISLSNLLSNLTYQNMVEAINNEEFCDLTLTIYNLNNSGESLWLAPDNQSIELLNLCPTPIVDIGLDTLIYTTGCDENGPYWNPDFYLINNGDEIITEYCIIADILSSPGVDTVCFNNLNITPGETFIQGWSNIYDWGVLNFRIINVNGENPPFEFGFENPLTVADNMYNQIISDEPNCIYGCTDEDANNYNPDATIDDGSCTYDIFGCTDPSANNFNPLANIDDGSCTYDVLGCTDPDALNFNPFANINDGSCEYVVYGCTDPFASNYNPFATVDDGSCILILAGCTDPLAVNYNSLATEDDGSCVYDLCGEYFAPNTFTPNNDGLNDGWAIITDPECWLEWQVLIYDRWGRIVWESTIPGEVWVGSNNNGSYYVADGIYVYLVRGIGYNPSNTFEFTGTITIFR